MYFRAVMHHVREVLKAYHIRPFTCKVEEQRLVAQSDNPFSTEAIEGLLKVPGVHSVIPARRIPVEFDAIMPVVKEELMSMKTLPGTFKVETKRSNKKFPLTSMDVSKETGSLIQHEFPGLEVAVKNPELRVEIRILDRNIYISTRKMSAVGGLPVGTSGHLISLISGGFDSPVASYLMFKRGCYQTFLFFYAYPFVGESVKDKILKLIPILAQYQLNTRLYVVSFGDIQKRVAESCKEDYRTLFFRKAMIQCATLLAYKVKAEGLLTGDSLGQVSSQTLHNIAFLDSVSPLPILRPLVGFNKIEIIEQSKKIGTHDISIIPHDDACSLFAPRHPVIRPNLHYLEKFSKEVELEEYLKKCLLEAEVYDFSLTGQRAQSD